MNILYISHERKLGGANLCLIDMVQQMKRKGHNVKVVVLLSKCPIAIKLKELGIETIPVFFGWWQMPENWNFLLKFLFKILHILQFLAEWKLIRLIKKDKIDIIHSNSSCIDLGARIAEKTNVIHIWHFREYGKADYELEFLKGREKSISFVNNCQSIVIFISKDLRNYYNDIEERNAKIVYDGISKDNISNKTFHNEVPVFLSAGNLSANKNQMLLLMAVEKLKKKGINRFEVIIAGTSSSLTASKEYEKELRQFIVKKQLVNVEMTGYVIDMKSLRKKTDIEVVASRREAFGRVTIEAMLSGNPVIASDAGANPELISSGKTGLQFKQDNAGELASKMLYFIENPNEISRMGKEAFEYAINNFLLDKNTDEIEKIYKVELMRKEGNVK